MLSFSCRLSSATATAGRNQSFSSQISPDQGIQYIPLSPPAQGNSPTSFSSQISPNQGTQCRLSSATATFGSNQSFSSQIKAHSACRCLTAPRELTEIPPPTCNAMAQPGRSWPRRCEAFVPLARSCHMKGMPRASLHYRGHRGRHCCEDCNGTAARKRAAS
jgi:hypothetical protein